MFVDASGKAAEIIIRLSKYFREFGLRIVATRSQRAPELMFVETRSHSKVWVEGALGKV